MKKLICCSVQLVYAIIISFAQQKGNDVTAPLHAMNPIILCLICTANRNKCQKCIDKVFHYLDSTTPPAFDK